MFLFLSTVFFLIFESNLLISFYKKQYRETHRNKNFSIRADGIEEALSVFNPTPTAQNSFGLLPQGYCERVLSKF